MLKALYAYAAREQLVLPPGYASKPIKAYISLSADGSFLGLVLSEDGPGVPCPDIGSLANGTDKCNVLAEKRSVILPDTPGPKSRFFLSALESAGAAEPRLAVCLQALQDPETLALIKREADAKKIKASDRLCFMVDGTSVLESPRLPGWWQEYRQQFTGGEQESKTLCLITGEPTVPLRTAPPINGLKIVGGHARGDALICFDKAAFCSYELKQAANAPVAENAYAGVKAALDNLIARAPTLGGVKFVHWYDRPLEKEDDLLLELFSGFAEEDEKADADADAEAAEEVGGGTEVLAAQSRFAAENRADQLVNSVKSGEHLPPLDSVYYILLLSGVGGRIMIRRWDQGNYTNLQKNIKLWQDDLALVDFVGGGRVKPHKLTARLIRLLARQKSDRKVFDRLAKELAGITPAVVAAILSGGPLPDAVAARALAFIRSQMLESNDEVKSAPVPDDMCCQWLKAWLIRKNRSDNKEEQLMAEYNPDHSIPAYHCGAIMAVYAALQKRAMPEVNAGVIQRYYAAASQTPALVIGRLSTLSNYHFDKISEKWLVELFTELLDAAYCSLGDTVPVTLNLEQQAYFALGYRQLSAEIERRKNEKYAEFKEKKAQKNAVKNDDKEDK